MAEECLKSYANGWKPIPEQTCRQAKEAYSIAVGAWVQARAGIEQDKPVTQYVVQVLTYILSTADRLKQFGLALPDSVQDFVEQISKGVK